MRRISISPIILTLWRFFAIVFVSEEANALFFGTFTIRTL